MGVIRARTAATARVEVVGDPIGLIGSSTSPIVMLTLVQHYWGQRGKWQF